MSKEKEVIKEDNILTLSKEEWKNFQTILNTPQKSTKALNDLMSLEGFDK